ncbi:MAG TPA: MarR family transcriptional regulator [Gemmatimonadales bacterium]|nr:MarR family transcriptional regulator [Gemmatimonadales bacterium]
MSPRLSSDHVDAWRALLTSHAELTERIDTALRAAGVIPLRWYDALLCLYEAPGRRLRLAELAKAALLSRSGLSRLVDRLEEAGLLTREPCQDDARGAYAVLTSEGLHALRRCWRVYGPEIARVGRRLTLAEARTLRGLLVRLLEAEAERA